MKTPVKLVDPTTVKYSDGSVRVVYNIEDLRASSGDSGCVLCDDDGQTNAYIKKLFVDKLDYAAAKSHFSQNPYVPVGGCTSCYFGSENIVLRNYDWYYDNMMEFVVETSDTRYFRSIGIAAQPSIMLEPCGGSFDTSLVPFYMLDGINVKGLYASMNVVPISPDIPVATTIPTDEKRDSISSMMVVRYVLDRFDNAADAVDYLSKYVEIYQPKSLIEQGYCLHYHIIDKANTSLVLEFNGSSIFVGANHIVTNFYHQGVTDLSWIIPTPYSYSQGGDKPTSIGLKPNSQGLERFNICFNKVLYDGVQDIQDALSFGSELYYSTLYTENTAADVWYSELVGVDGLTIDSPVADFAGVLEDAREAYSERDRTTPLVWITRHSCAYNLDTLEMVFNVEECPQIFSDGIRIIR